MLQNTYFCAPNPQSQAYIHYQGINLYPMNLIYAPTSPSYFLMSDFQGNLVHQLFNKNTLEQINHQNQTIKTQNSSPGLIQISKKVKIQANESSSLDQSDQNNLVPIKTEEIEGNQHECLDENIKLYPSKFQKMQDSRYFKPIQKQQKNLNTRKRIQEVSITGRSQWWKQIVEQIQLDGIGMIKEFSKELIIYILKNQDSKDEALQSIKNDISELISKRLNKSRQTTQESLDTVAKILSTKFSKFKKTKEEMIKYIFRRIFNTKSKPDEVTEFNWKLAQKIHKQNSSTFKSMNMKFVEKQFQNPIFVQLFSLFLDNFQLNFEKENEDRIDRLNFIVALAIITEDMSELRSYKKLPWNRGVIRSMQTLFGDLKEIQRNTKQSDIMMEFSGDQQQFQMDEEESSSNKKKDPKLFKSNTKQSDL